jgi:hypothetical protein
MTLVGVVVALVVSVLLYRTGITVHRVASYATALALLSSCLIFQSYLVFRGLHNPRNILERQNRDIAEILGANAVMAGNFAPAFTIDNNHRNFIYPYGGFRSTQKSSLHDAGVTHLADPLPLVRTAAQHFQLYDTIPVLKVWAREATYVIYGLQRQGYRPTDYELAVGFRTGRQLDSALLYLARFLGEYPQNLTAQLERANILATVGQVEAALVELERISQENSDIYYAHYLVGQSYLPIAQITKDRKILRAMREEYETVVELNPYVARNLRLYELIEVIRKTEKSWKSN